jgi:hypothetical protein
MEPTNETCVWVRHCPQCGEWLYRCSPQETCVCKCGWKESDRK